MKNIILHIGAAKTATTFLQDKVFPSLEHFFVASQGDKYFQNELLDLQWINDYLPDENIFSDEYLQESSENIRKFLGNHQNILISHEGLVGDGRTAYENRDYCLNALKTMFPEAKIILCIRRQDDWINSYYNEFRVKFNAFNTKKFKRNTGFKEFISFDFSWYELCKSYIDAFGRDNVLILPYELLRDDLGEFLRLFYDFTNIDNGFYPEVSTKVNTRKKQSFIKKIFSKRTALNDKETQEILARYNDSNKQLSELINIDLSKWGYHK